MRTYLAATILMAAMAAPLCAAPGANSAYMTDLQTSQVEDATSSSIGEVNMITCIIHAMRPEALVNEPSYIALIDKNKCDAEKRSSTSNSGASDGAQAAASYITATVTSTRADNNSPMITKAWLALEEDGAHVQINVHISATEAPSDANPYGAFRLDYCGQLDGTGDCSMNGYLQAANGGIDYYDSNVGDQTQTTAMKLAVTSGGGNGRLERHDDGNGGGDAAFAFAYDASFFRRQIDNDDQCFSRDARDPGTGFSVWRYGLYDSSTGSRIERHSGFPIEFTAQGTTYQGFLGYFGLSLPAEASAQLTNGATVTRVDYSSGETPTRSDYQVVKGDGKLTKFTKRETTLALLDQIRFNTFVGADANDFFAGATPNVQYEVYWNEGSQDFIVSGQFICSPNGCQASAVPGDHHVDVSYWSSRGGVQGWSQSLGGEVFVDLHAVSGTIDAALVPVNYRTQDLVYPADLPPSLYCIQNCPTQTSIEAYFNSSDPNNPSSPYAGTSYNNFNPTLAGDILHYATDTASAALTGGDGTSDAVTFTDAHAYEQHPQFGNGVTSGRLFVNLDDALCDDVTGASAGYCDWKVNSAEVYYQWQTGPNNWNQFAAVKDTGGDFVQFEAPLQLSFHVPDDAAVYGQYQGTNVVLQYGGFGDLWGIPGSCVSANTNAPVDCNTQNSRYVPSFVVPYDQQLGVATSTGDDQTIYLVKWLEREIRFARKTGGECNALTLPDGTVALPGASDLKNPSDPNSDVYNGVKPEVTDAPRVVQGEVKY